METLHCDLYDFDKTVFPSDSLTSFWLFCLWRCPWILLFLPLQLIAGFFWSCRLLSTGSFKSLFLCFLRGINTPKMVGKFWDSKEDLIEPWFRPSQRRGFTVVCSASPEFLLDEICKRMKVDKLVCTKIDPYTGSIQSKNCRGEEKVKRLKEELPNLEVERVYTDSIKHDRPILELGKEMFLVTDGVPKRLEKI